MSYETTILTGMDILVHIHDRIVDLNRVDIFLYFLNSLNVDIKC